MHSFANRLAGGEPVMFFESYFSGLLILPYRKMFINFSLPPFLFLSSSLSVSLSASPSFDTIFREAILEEYV